MSGLSASLLAALPLVVTGVEIQNPIITIFGETWSLTIACPWNATIREQAVTWEDDELEDRIWDLIGENLTAVVAEQGSTKFVFSFSAIRAHPDTNIDPWVLELPTGLVIGSQS